jgi:protein-S-isoprenylcysteine O-methyltransferase Ste14
MTAGFEERDLRRAHPEYAEYRRQVLMLFPRWRHPAAAFLTHTHQEDL